MMLWRVLKMTNEKDGLVCLGTGLDLPYKVNDLNELKKLASNDGHSINVFYNLGGFARSSKVIYYNDDSDTWDVLHMIDDSEEELSTDELFEFTHIGTALEKGALYYEGY